MGENVGDMFAAHVAGGSIAVSDLSQPGGPRDFSYAALDDRCNAVARSLVAHGLAPGDRIGIMSLNRIEYFDVLFGAMRAGCIPVPINIKLAPETIAYIAADAGVKIIFADRTSRARCPEGTDVVVLDGEGADGYAAFVDSGPFETWAPEPNEAALQPYTSGSTGRPKGLLLSHRGIYWVSRVAVRMRRMDASVCSLVAAPMFHKNAMQTIKQTMTAGGRIVLLGQFDVKKYIAAIGAYRCTLLAGVPTMFALLLREPALLAETDLSSVGRIGFGSAPGSDALFDALVRAFPNASIENNYGITEGGPIVFGPHPDGLERPRNSVGTVLEGAEVRLVGGPGEDEGVLHIQSPGVMLGYHNRHEETASRLSPDGWLDTGDVLRRDGDGFFYFVGRSDDMFVCGGENIYPGEVESMLERHPDIVQAVVVPVDDEIKGQLPYAFVVARRDADRDEQAVKDYTLANGPAYAHPRRVFFVDEIPLAGTGKIDRKTLMADAAGRAARG